ncbi:MULTISPECIES: ester cyclase [Thalassospira]|uniref:ester cyclase n=1 Tax=Thalassospira TaxID=168934 RepID=UPI0015F0EEAD|nr:ester cyclase [Thalassospira profundimaris]
MTHQLSPKYITNRDVVLRFFEESHSHNPGIVYDLVTSDIVTHGFPCQNPHDLDSYHDFFVGLNAAFPDMAFTILTMVAEHDHVAVRFRIQATHHDVFAGIAASGNKVDFTGMVLYRLRDLRIAETWLHPDVTTLMAQLTTQ